MKHGIDAALDDLYSKFQDIIDGVYVLPTALGPNSLSKASIKAKSITGTNISVTDLSAVNTKTGNLTVNGSLTVTTNGSFQSGKTSYSDVANAGYWMGIDSGVTKIRVGDIGAANGFTWDGSSLAILGSVTATSGTIGGWTINSTSLTGSAGVIGLASSGSVRIWSGNATPASAPFQVDSAGAMTSTAGSIGGWTIDATGIRLGSSSTARGIDSGSTAFYAGGATPASAPFRVSTAGALTATSANITGTITTSNITATGGTIGGLTVGPSTITFGNTSLGSGGISTTGTAGLTVTSSGTTSGITLVNGATTIGYVWASTTAAVIQGTGTKDLLLATSSGTQMQVNNDLTWLISGTASVTGDSTGRTIISGNIFPQNQTTYYIGSSSSLQLAGPVDFLNHTTGGSTATWTAAGPATSYIEVKIGGTTRRIPFYTNT